MDSETKKNIVNEPLWSTMQSEYESTHKPLLDHETQRILRKRAFDFKDLEKIYSSNSDVKTSGPVTDADLVPLKVSEIKKVCFTFLLNFKIFYNNYLYIPDRLAR